MSMPSPIACSTPIHQMDCFPYPTSTEFDRNLDMIEQTYMSSAEEKDQTIILLKRTIAQKDEIISLLSQVQKIRINQSSSLPVAKSTAEHMDDEEPDVSPTDLLSCKKNAKGKPKRFVRNLLKLI